MAQKTCPSCGGSGLLGYDIERPQTCSGCSGRGFITVPDLGPGARPGKSRSSNSSRPSAKKATKRDSRTDQGVWSLFKPAPPAKKESRVNKSERRQAKSRGPESNKSVSETIKAVAALLGFVGGFIIFEQTSNVGAAIVGGVIVYLLVAASIVIVNNVLDVAVELTKKLIAIAVWGSIILAVVYVLSAK